MYPNMTKPKTEHPVDIPDNLIKKLLTDCEWRMVRQRFVIMNHLEEGLTIRSIAEKVKVGTDTVVRVARMAEGVGLRKNISQSKIKKINKLPWVFGKSD